MPLKAPQRWIHTLQNNPEKTTEIRMSSFRLLGIAVALLFTPPSVAADDPLTEEQRQKIKALFQEAQEHVTKEEYAKSNAIFVEVIKLLPVAEKDALDGNRAFINLLMAKNTALLNQNKEALEQISTAISNGFWDEQTLKADPSFNALRTDPGFKKVLTECQRAIGSVAFGLKDVHGNSIEKKNLEGKVLVINVFGTWCPPCMMEIPHFVKLQKQYEKNGVQVIGMSWERRPPDDFLRKHVKRFVDGKQLNYPVTMMTEGRLMALGVNSFPTTIFVGRDGTVRQRFSGYRDYRVLSSIVKPLANEKSPEPANAAKAAAGD